MKGKAVAVISIDAIEDCIYFIRGQKVMLDHDLAALYGTTTKAFNQAIRRNTDRFSQDFMFVLTTEGHHSLRSQFVTLKTGRGRHHKPRIGYLQHYDVRLGKQILRGHKL